MQIKHRYTDAILWSDDCDNIADSLTAAVRAGVDLSDANLTDANLSGAILTDANLTGANLTDANLYCANLERANLTDANLYCAYLERAILTDANLSGANLSGAYLTGAILTDANLTGANLYYANLERANLTDANLSGANLTDANLTDANLTGAYLPPWRHVPESGAFQAYKAVRSDDGPAVLLIQIDADTPRINGIGSHKCRAERVLVLEQVHGDPATEFVSPTHRDKLTYRIGAYTIADKYVDDYRLECTGGIHFFMTMQEAIDWSQR
jgi:hypothetical protein